LPLIHPVLLQQRYSNLKISINSQYNNTLSTFGIEETYWILLLLILTQSEVIFKLLQEQHKRIALQTLAKKLYQLLIGHNQATSNLLTSSLLTMTSLLVSLKPYHSLKLRIKESGIGFILGTITKLKKPAILSLLEMGQLLQSPSQVSLTLRVVSWKQCLEGQVLQVGPQENSSIFNLCIMMAATWILLLLSKPTSKHKWLLLLLAKLFLGAMNTSALQLFQKPQSNVLTSCDYWVVLIMLFLKI